MSATFLPDLLMVLQGLLPAEVSYHNAKLLICLIRLWRQIQFPAPSAAVFLRHRRLFVLFLLTPVSLSWSSSSPLSRCLGLPAPSAVFRSQRFSSSGVFVFSGCGLQRISSSSVVIFRDCRLQGLSSGIVVIKGCCFQGLSSSGVFVFRDCRHQGLLSSGVVVFRGFVFRHCRLQGFSPSWIVVIKSCCLQGLLSSGIVFRGCRL